MKHHKDDPMSVVLFLTDRYLMVSVAFLESARLLALKFVAPAVNLPKQEAISVFKKIIEDLLSKFHDTPKKNPLSIRSTSTNTQGAAHGLELLRSGTPKF